MKEGKKRIVMNAISGTKVGGKKYNKLTRMYVGCTLQKEEKKERREGRNYKNRAEGKGGDDEEDDDGMGCDEKGGRKREKEREREREREGRKGKRKKDRKERKKKERKGYLMCDDAGDEGKGKE